MRVSGYDCCRYCMSGCEVGMLKKNFLRLSSCYYHHHPHSLPTSITLTFALFNMGMEMEVEGVMVYRIIWVGSGLRFSMLYRYHSPTILTHDHFLSYTPIHRSFTSTVALFDMGVGGGG